MDDPLGHEDVRRRRGALWIKLHAARHILPQHVHTFTSSSDKCGSQSEIIVTALTAIKSHDDIMYDLECTWSAWRVKGRDISLAHGPGRDAPEAEKP